MPKVHIHDLTDLFEEETTVAEHYGYKEDEYDEFRAECLKRFFLQQDLNQVIDGMFKDIKDPQVRAQIHAYAVAFKNYCKLRGEK